MIFIDYKIEFIFIVNLLKMLIGFDLKFFELLGKFYFFGELIL